MNKIFKVVWSEARNAYVVVSEIAKNHGSKSCSTKKLLTMLIATGVMTCASMAPAMADNPAAEALKHSTVTAGYNITVTPKDNSDGGKEYNVDLKNDIYLAGDDPDAMVSISGSKGTIWTSSSVTAGSVAVGTAKADGTTPFFVNSNGAFYAADGKFSVDKDGNVNANSVQTNALNSKYNLSVGTANVNGTMPFFVNSNGAFYAANGKLVVDKDGKVTATEGEIGNVVLKNGVLYKNTALRDGELYVGDADGNYSQITPKSAKLGQVTIDEKGNIASVNSIQTNALNAKYNLSVGTANENGTVPFFVNSNGAFYAANGKLVVDKDGKVTATEGEIGNVVLKNGVLYKNTALRDGELYVGDADGNYSQITPKSAKLGQVTIDEKGNIAGVNSIQTNALNAKYNLSVGTANENGTVPFFVNSNGAFYGANGSFVVDKDGKVTATAGEIGNVVLQNGVFTGHSALRDGELFVGDASGNYSQITTKGAKLGKVTVAVDGKISGVAAGAITADSTDAVNGSQLHAVATEAGKHSKVVNGNNTNVEETTVDGQKVYKVNLNNNIMVGDVTGKYVSISGTNGTIEATGYIATKDRVYADKGAKLADIDVTGDTISNGDAKLALNGAAGTAGMINGKGASVYMQDGYTVINSKVAFNQNGKISGVAAGAVTADSTDAVNGSQLHAVATEAAKHSKVVSGNNINVEETDVDGQKFYKVNMNKDIILGDLTGKYVNISGTNGTIEATGAIATKDRVYADKGAKLADIDVTGDTISNGDAKLALNGAAGTAGMINGKGASVYMQDGYTVINSKVAFNQNGKISGVAAGAVTADSTDAVNGSQLHAVATEAAKHSKVVSGNNINVEETDVDGQKFYKVNMNKDIILGDLTGKYVNISGTNGTIEATGAIATKDRVYADKGAKLADIDVTGNKISNGASSIVLDGSNVKVNDKVTIDQNGKISGVAAGEVSKTSTDAINGSQLNQTNENVAALDKRVTKNEADIAQNKADIAQNKADIATNKANIEKNANDIATNKQNIDKLNTRVDGVEKLAKQHTTVTAGDNIAVTETTNKDGGKEYKVALDKDIKLDSVTANTFTAGQTVMNNDGLKVGKDVSVTATAVTAGKTSISDEGVKVGDKTYISADGLNANDQKVTNVKAGDISETSKDAVNGSQLYKTNQEVVNNTNRINKLGSRVNKVGAGAAALAALHPMDFDPDDKLTFSAGYGNYAGENAAAIGAYYRPDEKVMFSVAGTVGNGENMVNAGVSFALDRTNHVSNSRTALAREVIDLRGQLAVMGAKMAKMEKAFGMLDETKTKLFPDVPANHWAYEYIAKLAGNGYIEGYPDGNFGGDRLMTRYEFAAMLYRAIENGAALEEKIIKEFEPELGRIRVDRISGEDGDRDKIERVRVNDTKGERDHYGNKLAK
mgnify:CR=1 FL=1